jgi:hypothetical protein
LLIYTVVVLLYIFIVNYSDYLVIHMVWGHHIMIYMILGHVLTNGLILGGVKKIRI